MPIFVVLVVIALGVAGIIFGPLLTIWALNTLFALAIPYTLKTWFASALLTSIMSGAGGSFVKATTK
jgi:hypothetical protein